MYKYKILKKINFILRTIKYSKYGKCHTQDLIDNDMKYIKSY